MCFSETPGALVLRAGYDGDDPLLTATAIARHLQLGLADGAIADIAFDTGASETTRAHEDPAAWWDHLDRADRVFVGGALDRYIDSSADHGGRPITWARELFFDGTRSVEPAAENIDITGRPRCLLCGPQIMLPPGLWSLSAAFDLSPEAAEHSFVMEVSGGKSLGRTILRPERAGPFEIDLALALEDLPDEPIDFRLSNERAAFGGHLTLRRVILRPQSEASTEPAPIS